MAVASASTAQSTAGDLAFHARGFELSLASANKRPDTVKSYLEAVEQLDAFLAAQGMPRDVENIRREHVESFQRDQLERTKPASAANRYRSLQQFFKWLVIEGRSRSRRWRTYGTAEGAARPATNPWRRPTQRPHQGVRRIQFRSAGITRSS